MGKVRKSFNLLQYSARLFLGSKLNQKVVVFESDDWGAARTPTRSASQSLSRVFEERWENPFYNIDTLESSEDLDALFSILRSFRDTNGAHPKITANTIVGNPDFDKIERDAFCKYSFEVFTDTLSRERGAGTVEGWKNGVGENLLVPQLHGREHLHALAWMELLRAGNQEARSAFHERVCNFPTNVRQSYAKRNLSAALNLIGVDGEDLFQRRYLQDAASEFRKVFGFDSKSFVAPSYIWNKNHEDVLGSVGVCLFQGIGYQYSPVDFSSSERLFRYYGQRNSRGQMYTIRNAFYEPARRPDIDWVSRCLRQVGLAFRFGLPAVVGTHRANFVGSLSPKNRDQNLSGFKDLIRGIKKRWPETEFLDTVTLAERYCADNK